MSPSSILTSFLLLTPYFFGDTLVEFANNLSTIGYTIFFSNRLFIRLTIQLHATVKTKNKKTDMGIVIHKDSFLCSKINPNSNMEHINQKTTIPTNTQLCKNLYFTYRITTFPDEDFSSTEYGCLLRLNICNVVNKFL